uniref:Uncharacterized protein n=1 Tax=Cucumis sativus TaxID=3659 RepID=A0A0A0K8U4_CUCSA
MGAVLYKKTAIENRFGWFRRRETDHRLQQLEPIGQTVGWFWSVRFCPAEMKRSEIAGLFLMFLDQNEGQKALEIEFLG